MIERISVSLKKVSLKEETKHENYWEKALKDEARNFHKLQVVKGSVLFWRVSASAFRQDALGRRFKFWRIKAGCSTFLREINWKVR